MRSFFDINVLIALLDPDHSHHQPAQDWWLKNREGGWASCPITENGFVRVLSNVRYPNDVRFSPSRLIQDLKDFILVSDHEFWEDNISLTDDRLFSRHAIISPSWLTDIYLLALAIKNRGRLVTFDRRIRPETVIGASENNLCIIEF